MQDIMKLAHQFLQNFCAGNQQNQALLHKHINLFLNPGVSGRVLSEGGFLFSPRSAFEGRGFGPGPPLSFPFLRF